MVVKWLISLTKGQSFKNCKNSQIQLLGETING